MKKIIHLVALITFLSITSSYAGPELSTWEKIKSWFTVNPGPKYIPLHPHPKQKETYLLPETLPEGNYEFKQISGKAYLRKSSKTSKEIQKQSTGQPKKTFHDKQYQVIPNAAYHKLYEIQNPQGLQGYITPKRQKLFPKKTELLFQKYGAGWE